MKKSLFIFLMTITHNTFSQIKYPETKKVNQEDNYFGTI